ncbi:MAG: acyl carrier protein [Actinobacteria bacterium]|nr:acyl carrier protein [Actinomycetota bacterium]
MIDDVESTIRGFLGTALDRLMGDIGDDTDIRELPGVDSVTLLQVVANIEDHYRVQFDDDLVFGVHTIGELATAVRELHE